GETSGGGLLTDARDAFAEFEAINAQLNYRHAELRRAAVGGQVAGQRFRLQQQDFRTIGADGDAARVPLIPGAEAAFTILETAAGLHRVDVTRWHRCRLLAGFAVRRAIHLLRARAAR